MNIKPKCYQINYNIITYNYYQLCICLNKVWSNVSVFCYFIIHETIQPALTPTSNISTLRSDGRYVCSIAFSSHHRYHRYPDPPRLPTMKPHTTVHIRTPAKNRRRTSTTKDRPGMSSKQETKVFKSQYLFFEKINLFTPWKFVQFKNIIKMLIKQETNITS